MAEFLTKKRIEGNALFILIATYIIAHRSNRDRDPEVPRLDPGSGFGIQLYGWQETSMLIICAESIWPCAWFIHQRGVPKDRRIKSLQFLSADVIAIGNLCVAIEVRLGKNSHRVLDF